MFRELRGSRGYEGRVKNWIRETGVGSGVWILTLWVQPRASKTEVVGVHELPEGMALTMRVAAPPVEGAANEEIVRFLKKAVGGAGVRVEILRGATGRKKEAQVEGPGLGLLDFERKLLGK
jgi:uncharacterized protein (TIGR00251 family)